MPLPATVRPRPKRVHPRTMRRRDRAAGAADHQQVFDEQLLIDVMSGRQRVLFRFLVTAWSVGLIVFYLWWFRGDHFAGWFKFVVNTLLLTWTLALPGYFLFFVSRIKRPNPRFPVPRGWRVAMVTTRAPSEPFAVVRQTLVAMLAQEYPHDTWLADEDPSEDIYRWCAEHGVRVSTRRGVADYHRQQWPRRTKCKEGNLAYFYDHYGYDGYEYVVQLDADHVPGAGYLEAMLRPFADPAVGYVSAPSICSKNGASSWSARGRLFAEAIMHGPLQAGYSDGFAPLCIGSHYAVRTRALREIGGLGPELAEDHSTTLMMNAHGWRGIHALDATAIGEGPATLGDCITQEFQWSRSLMVVMLTLMPKYWSSLPSRLRFQFLFSQLWFPLFGISMLAGLILPVIAVLFNQPWVHVSYVDFVLHSLPLACLSLAIVAFLKGAGLLRPVESPIFGWEAALFQVIRWPWALYGSLMGVVMAVRQQNVVFQVTPKGMTQPTSLPWKVLLPYASILILTFLPALSTGDAGAARGYYFFLILSQVIYILALFSIVLIHRHETAQDS